MRDLKIIEIPTNIAKMIREITDNNTNVFLRNNIAINLEKYRDDYHTLSEMIESVLKEFNNELVKSKQKKKQRK